MPTAPAADRFAFAAYALCAAGTALCIAPLWLVDLVPLLDFGQHLQLATILHDWSREPLYAQHYTRVPGLTPCWFFPTAVDLLAHLRGTLWAGRVVLSLSLAAVPVAALWLLRVAGHSPWLVLGVLPWTLNYDFFLGYVDHLAALPIFLGLLAAHLRWLQQPRWYRGLLVAALIAWLAVTHYLLFVVGLCSIPLLALTMGLRRRPATAPLLLLRDVGLGLPALALLAPWANRQAAAAGGWKAWLANPAAEHPLPLADLRQLPDRLLDAFAPHGPGIDSVADLLLHRPGEVVGVLWILGLGAWLLGSVRQQRLARETEALDRLAKADRGGANTSYLGWAFVLVLIAYFALPEELRRPIWLYGIHFRLVEVLAILAVLALPLRPAAPPAVPIRVGLGTLAMGLCAVMMPLSTMQSFLLARTEFAAIRQAFDTIPRGSKVLTLHRRSCSRYLRPCVLHDMGAWYTVLRGGYAPMAFGDPALQRIAVRADRQLPAPPVEDPDGLNWQDHGRFYDYIAVYKDLGEDTSGFEAYLKNLPRIFQRGNWQVFQNLKRTPFPPPSAAAERETMQATLLVEYAVSMTGLDWDTPQQRVPVHLRAPHALLARLGWLAPVRAQVAPLLAPDLLTDLPAALRAQEPNVIQLGIPTRQRPPAPGGRLVR